jgi:hypothetical protein
MRRQLLLAPLLAVGLVLATAAPAAAATASDVRGIWTATDIDGSNVTLAVAPRGDDFRLIYFDDLATAACDDVPALLTGSATLSGDTLSGTISGFCFDGTRTGVFDVQWEFDAGPPPTLTDIFGAEYTRLFG